MAREHNHGNKQGLKPLPISISSLWDSNNAEIFLICKYANSRQGISLGNVKEIIN